MALYPGPYELGAPDGHTYFTILPPQLSLLRGYSLLLQAQAVAARIPGGEGRVRALAIDTVLLEVTRAVERAALESARVAEREIVANIDASRLRPDPPGKSSGTRMRDAIRARPIITKPPGGAVGIGDLSELGQVVGDDGQEYWRAQEFGSSHRVGAMMYGYFQPGDARPSQSQFRQHPLFWTSKPGARTIIERPIPEKAFLRKGAEEAAVFRRQAFLAAQAKAVAELRLIESGNHPRLRAVRSFVGRSLR